MLNHLLIIQYQAGLIWIQQINYLAKFSNIEGYFEYMLNASNFTSLNTSSEKEFAFYRRECKYFKVGWKPCALIFYCYCKKLSQICCLKPHTFIVLQFCSPEVWNWWWLNHSVGRAMLLSRSFRIEMVSLSFSTSRSHPHTLAHGLLLPSSKLATLGQACLMLPSLWFCFLIHFPLIRIQIIQDNFITLRSDD